VSADYVWGVLCSAMGTLEENIELAYCWPQWRRQVAFDLDTGSALITVLLALAGVVMLHASVSIPETISGLCGLRGMWRQSLVMSSSSLSGERASQQFTTKPVKVLSRPVTSRRPERPLARVLGG